MASQDSALPLDKRRAIHRLADLFENDFRLGKRPAIEDHLRGKSSQFRQSLLRGMLSLKVRCSMGEKPRANEYFQRFPMDRYPGTFTTPAGLGK